MNNIRGGIVDICDSRGSFLGAFGPSRHRVLVVGKWLRECSSGYRRRSHVGFSEAALRPCESRFGACWVLCSGLPGTSWGFLGASSARVGAFWGPRSGPVGCFGASLEPLGVLLGPLGALLGPPGVVSGGKARFLNFWSPSWAAPGAVLGPSWVVLGACWAVLGPSCAVLGPSWEPRGPSWGDLGGLLGRLGTSGNRKGENPKYLSTCF